MSLDGFAGKCGITVIWDPVHCALLTDPRIYPQYIQGKVIIRPYAAENSLAVHVLVQL